MPGASFSGRNSLRLGVGVALLVALGACSPEPVPRSYSEYLEDPVAREATLLRCNRDRAAARYDLECSNARRAAERIAAQAEAARREQLEATSERKRAAARQRIAAQAEARRQVEEMARQRAEAAYEANWTGEPGAVDAPPASPSGLPAPLPPGASLPRTTAEQSGSIPVSGSPAPQYLPETLPPGASRVTDQVEPDPVTPETVSPETIVQEPIPSGPVDSAPTTAQPLPTPPTPQQADVVPEGSATPQPEPVPTNEGAVAPDWQPFEPPPTQASADPPPGAE